MIQKINMGIVSPHYAVTNNKLVSQDNLTNLPVKNTKVPMPTLLAYMLAQSSLSGVNVSFYNSLALPKMKEKYPTLACDCVYDLSKRAGKKGQILDWIKVLPQNQLNRIDEIYDLADSLKQNGAEKLVIIGIGGSKHTVENLLHLNGFEDKAVFLSAVDPECIESFLTKKIGDKGKIGVLVASKSGTTLEPSYDFEVLQEFLGPEFKNYVCITDKDSSKSKLRQIANQKNFRCGLIHDDCGGRFGAFDDHSLVALAFCGMSKENMRKMLQASLLAQDKFLIPDIMQNPALQRAIFNVEAIINGKINQYDYYFGDMFEGTTLWNTQLKKESHKSLYKPSGDLIGPAFLHNSTESDLDEGNTTSFYTFNTVKHDNDKKHKLANALFNGSLKAYSERHPVSVISLKNLSPDSIAEFIELKHFETMYTGMMLRQLISGKACTDVLNEVIQPHVGIYKKEVNKILEQS